MAKYIKCGTSVFHVPSEEIMKIEAAHGSNSCTITYIGGQTVVGTISLVDAAAATALVTSLYATLVECINAGPDAAGAIVNKDATFTAVT